MSSSIRVIPEVVKLWIRVVPTGGLEGCGGLVEIKSSNPWTERLLVEALSNCEVEEAKMPFCAHSGVVVAAVSVAKLERIVKGYWKLA